MLTAQIHPNGFITIWDGPTRYSVQGMQAWVRTSLRRAILPDDSRPSCTCEKGHARQWCSHKEAARVAVLAELR